jgi:hypothetical protein
MTAALESRFAELGAQDVPDPRVVCKFFNPTGAGTWYVTAYDPEDRTIFGFASLFGDYNDEWGYSSLAELEAYRGPFGIGIERDVNWTERPFSEVQR